MLNFALSFKDYASKFRAIEKDLKPSSFPTIFYKAYTYTHQTLIIEKCHYDIFVV